MAIKVLRPGLAASLGAERFLREIGIAARLSHPHIVPLIDSGEAGGLLYYIQPHVPGGSLRERLGRERRLPVKDALRIANEVGAGLDYAHRNGFVHRDVKPENILFADGHAVLADFGVARACDAPGMAPVTDIVTDAGFAVGTPEYMSPEQASGEPDLGNPSDLYVGSIVSVACNAPTPPVDARLCPQTYEFGNTGCAEVTGIVLGSTGQPLSGTVVLPHYSAGGDIGGYNEPIAATGPDGRFQFRITRYFPRRSPVVPDTFSIYVIAQVLPPPGGGPNSLAVDSALLRLALAPVGAIPTPGDVVVNVRYP